MILPLDCVPLGIDYDNGGYIVATTHEEFLTVLRQHRNVMLAQTDWRIYNDSPLSEEEKAEWIAYRAYLRNLTDNLPDVLGPSIEIQDPPTSGGPLRFMDKLPFSE